jgi:pimeloyl-CoA synthetase
MKNFDSVLLGNKYYNKLRALKKPDHVQLKREMVDSVKQNFVGTLDQINKRIKEVETEADKTYKSLINEYYAKQNQIETEFKQKLFEENGVANNPKAEKAYQYIVREFDLGYNLQEIENRFEDIVELIK